ncbi:MAG: hypothetical protein H8D43_02195 [Chloroflexi bacterium]|nr:hypothetical protein [Chloroflexota bacterium]
MKKNQMDMVPKLFELPSRLGMHITVLGLFTVIILFMTLLLHPLSYDDPYITYRYAYNILQGQGFVYNNGEHVLSTTTPLYTLLLAVLGFFHRDLPSLGNIMSILSILACAMTLYFFGRQLGQARAGAIAGFLTLFFPLLWTTLGGEAALYSLAILASFAFYARGALELTAACMAVAVLTRPDGALVALIIGTHYLLTKHRVPWRLIRIYLSLAIPWYLYAWWRFGSPVPVTLHTKLNQAHIAGIWTFGEGLLRMAELYGQNPCYWFYLLFSLIGVGSVLLTSKRQKLLPLISWLVLYCLSFTCLAVVGHHWYYAPIVPPLMLLVALGLEVPWRWLVTGRSWGQRLQAKPVPKFAIWGAVVLLLIYPDTYWLRDAYLNPLPDGRTRVYREVGVWLAESAPPEASIGAVEIGIIGYYSNRRVIDFAGLLQPEVIDHLGTYEQGAIWATRVYSPTYVVANPGWFPKLFGSDWFQKAYSPVREFSHDRYEHSPIVVYANRCKTDKGECTIQ